MLMKRISLPNKQIILGKDTCKRNNKPQNCMYDNMRK